MSDGIEIFSAACAICLVCCIVGNSIIYCIEKYYKGHLKKNQIHVQRSV